MKMNIFKRLLALTMAVIMVLGMVPELHLHAHAEGEGGEQAVTLPTTLYVGGEKVIENGAVVGATTGTGWSYDTATATLYLTDGANISTGYSLNDEEASGIYCDGVLNIHASGSVSVTSYGSGIYLPNGTLNLYAAEGAVVTISGQDTNASGIAANNGGMVTFSGKGTVSVTSAQVGYATIGIFAGDVRIDGITLNAKGSSNFQDIYAENSILVGQTEAAVVNCLGTTTNGMDGAAIQKIGIYNGSTVYLSQKTSSESWLMGLGAKSNEIIDSCVIMDGLSGTRAIYAFYGDTTVSGNSHIVIRQIEATGGEYALTTESVTAEQDYYCRTAADGEFALNAEVEGYGISYFELYTSGHHSYHSNGDGTHYFGCPATCPAAIRGASEACSGSDYSSNDDTHSFTCGTCGDTVTEAHSTTKESDKAATCTAPAYCSVCQSEYGEPLGHNWENGVCSNGCGTQHDPHSWENGTCTVCKLVCAHETYVNGICSVCGQRKVVTVEFDYNGGKFVAGWEEADTTSYSTYFGEEVTLGADPIAHFNTNAYREGYILTGWNTKPDGTGTDYGLTGTITMDTMTLYAQWGECTHEEHTIDGCVCGLTDDTIHSFTKYVDNGDGTHDQVCTCGKVGVDNEAHSTTADGDKPATCANGAYCSVCESYYGEVDKTNHDETVAYVNGFCPNCDAFEPAVLVDGVYQISNAGQLYWFAAQVNSGKTTINGKLMKDIQVNQNVLKTDGTLNGDGSNFRTWTPIGNYSYGYDGTFDGGSHTVSGLYFNNSEITSVGLFGDTNSTGKVRNVGVTDSYFKGKSYVGGVVGWNGGTVTGCYNTGTVSGEDNVGGVVGYNASRRSITDCYNTGAVSGSSNVGGVVGKNHSATTTNCYNTGAVSGSDDVGGVVGNNASGTITNCYNTGAVSGNKYVGGVVGYSTKTVTGCYNTGAVSGSSHVGGVVGYNASGTTTNCYNTGAVSGSSHVGGVAGYSTKTVTNCYYDKTVYTGRAIGSNDGTATKVEGKSTAQFASGEVAYLLSQGENGSIWGQDIDTDPAPIFSDAKVYYGYRSCGDTEKVYTNNANVFPEKPEHTQNPTYTDNHNGTHSAVYPCCGTTVTEDHTMDTATGKCACDYQFGFYVERDIEIDGLYHETYWFDNLSDALSYAHGSTDYGQYTTQSATVRLHRDLTIEEGETFSFQKQVVLDTNSFSVTNSGTLALEGYTYSTIPAAITGGTVTIGDKTYLWSSENEKWICAEGSHVTELEENKATCAKAAICDLCGTSYGEVDKTKHDSSVECVNGFCPYCDAFEPAKLVDGVYQISNAGNLYWFADKVTNENAVYGSADAILTCDITVNENVLAADGTANAGTFREWMPIGKVGFIDNKKVEYPYTGTFEGNGKTVSGLYFNDTSANFSVGLFSLVGEGGKVQNVGVADSYLCGTNTVGAVAGTNFGTVTNCYNTGTVSGTSSVGGVVGYNTGTVTGCYNTGTVSGESSVGGVVGNNIVRSGEVYYTPIVTDCHNSGTVSGSDSVGGVVGNSSGDSRHKGIVTGCYNTGTVSGTTYVGGVVGSGNASNCYNTGTVSGTTKVGGVVGNCMGEASVMGCYSNGTVSGTTNVGGVAGYLMGDAILVGCYNTGTVSGESNVGGVVGWNWNGTCTNCYFDSTVYTGNAIGTNEGTATDVEGKSTERFASGEVAYLLSQGENGDIWGQTIGTDPAPIFSDAKVYYGYRSCGDTEKVYTNNANVFPEKPEHTQNPTYTDNHDGTHSAVYPCCGTTVSPKPHAMDTATGKCVCGLQMAEASVTMGGTATYYETLNEAIQAVSTATAEDDATVRLEQSIDLGDSTQWITSGVFTLDLNGKELKTSDIGLTIHSANVTIVDSSASGTGQINGGTYGVEVNVGGTVEILGGTVSGEYYGVFAGGNSTATISGGTVSGSYSVFANDNSTVTISGGTVSGGRFGVYAFASSAVKVTGGEVSGDSYGVYAFDNSTVKISGGTISGVSSNNSNVTISGGTVSGEYAVSVSGCTVKILGGEYYGSYSLTNSTVTISGGSISSTLIYSSESTVTLTLGTEGVGATFSGGITVYGTTLQEILGEGAGYWQGGKMIVPTADQLEITGGDVTIKKTCDHVGSQHTSATDNHDGAHIYDCTVCGISAVEEHSFENDAHQCVCDVIETFTVTVYDGNENIVVSLTNATATYGQDFVTELTSDAEKEPHYKIRYYDVGEDRYDDFTYENGKLTIPAENITGDIEVRVYPYVTVTFHGNGGIFSDPASGTQYDPLVRQKDYGKTGYLLQESSEYREGHAFAGLNTKPDGTGTSYRADGEYTYLEDLELYVQWEVNTYTYQVETYTMDAYGNYGEPVTEEKSAPYGTQVNATPNSGAEGFYLDTEHADSLLTATVPANNDLVLKVYIGREQYPITWDLNGGGTDDNDLPDSMYYGVSQLTIFDKFVKEGYTFSHLEDASGNQYVDGSPNSDCRRFYDVDMPVGGLTLKAIWTVNSYALHVQDQTLNVDYGTALTDALSDITPEKTGHTFTVWSYYYLDEEEAKQPYTGTTMPAVELYAEPVFTPIEYKITWILNGCTVNTEIGRALPETLPYTGNTDTHQLLVALDEPAGYHLTGFKDGNGNKLNYSLGNGYLSLSVTGDMIVEAIIEPNSYMATWETGDGGSYEKEFKYGETITIPDSEIFRETFRKAGYTLVGWNGYTEGMTMPIDGVTFKAKWQINPASLDVTSGTYNGTAHKPTVTVEGLTEGEDFTVTYPADMTSAGEKVITVTGLLGGETTVTYTIEKAPAPAITFPTVLNAITYGQQLQDAKLSFYENELGGFDWTAPIDVPESAGVYDYALAFYPNREAMNNYVWKDTSNAQWIESHSALCITAKVTVNRAASIMETAPTEKTLTYNGQPQELVTAGSVVGGTLQYSVNGGEWSEAVPTAIEAGNYQISYQVVGNSNYVGIGVSALPMVQIQQATLTVTAQDHTITYGDTPSDNGITYDGFVNGETEAVLGGAVAYTYNYGQYGNVGTYKITPGGVTSDNYEITFMDGILTVNPKGITEADVELTGTLTYTGRQQTQAVAVADGVTYEVTGNQATNAGTYRLTVTGTGNYTGSVTKTWSIAKANQTVQMTEPQDMVCGGSHDLSASAETQLTYVSSDPTVVSVGENGTLTALKAGAATITITAQETDNYLSAQKTVTIAIGHSYETEITAPTCEDKGYTTYTCVCSHSYVADYVDANGHAPKAAVEENRVEATCEKDGSYEMVTYCGTCNKELSRIKHTIDAIDHDYDDGVITTQPGCETEGIKTFTCANDKSHTYTEKVSATGHDPKAAVEENRVEATCEKDGSYEMITYCGTCDKELTRTQHIITAAGHSFDEWTVAKAPTCTVKGQERRDCSACDHYETRLTAALGHEYTDPMDPSCEVCGEHRKVYVESIPMLRLYNPVTGEHHYTGSAEERDTLVRLGWNYEGVAWNAPVVYGDPVCRYYNPNTGDHHYTMCGVEGENLIAEGWIYEGVAWNSASSEHLPIYRLYNPNATIGIHHYTGSAEERDNLVAAGWNYEGIAWYALLY